VVATAAAGGWPWLASLLGILLAVSLAPPAPHLVLWRKSK
jgi:hypothetical protein